MVWWLAVGYMIYHIMDIGNAKDIRDVWCHGGYRKPHMISARKGSVPHGL